MDKDTLPCPANKNKKVLALVLLIAILALGTFLRFHQLGEADIGNQYYAAAVKSMLQSWHNFFFVAFEPGGSVSVDKPPLGLWVQCVSAYFLGVNGTALALPNATAGVLSIIVLYDLVRRPFGRWAGLLAALALALTPVAISAERNNTIDGLLVFVLLLAAWAFVRSVQRRKVGWLMAGAALVGLGFNIKMLQAFLPLPGLYGLYFFGAKYKWGQKILHLTLATLLMLVVSFSWAVAVDLVPPENRPYVGGSEDNTVMELIFGHNGIARLIGGGLRRLGSEAPGRFPTGQQAPYPPALPGQALPYQQPRPGVQPPPGFLPQNQPPAEAQQFPYGQAPAQQGSGNVMDVGTPGTVRLFTFPLAGEIGWILPFVLGGLAAIMMVLWKRPCGAEQAALMLWAGWLVPEAIYFTYSTGIMHAYYMIMMGAPLAALFAMSGWAFLNLMERNKAAALSGLTLLGGGTIVFQAGLLDGRTALAPWATAGAVLLLLTGLALAARRTAWREWMRAGLTLMLISMLAATGLWSALTTFNQTPNAALPYSGPAQEGHPGQATRLVNEQAGEEVLVNPRLLNFLLENYDGEKYLLATLNANQAAPFILETGLPVFTFGGFGGMDVIVDADGLAEMVAAGELRFVLNQGLESRPEIIEFLRQNCGVVPMAGTAPDQQGQPGMQAVLIDCGR